MKGREETSPGLRALLTVDVSRHLFEDLTEWWCTGPREIVLLDKVRERAKALATDMRYGAPLSPTVDVRDGDYGDLAGAALVMITAGVNEKTGGAIDRSDPAGRLKLLDTNARIHEDIIPQVVKRRPMRCFSLSPIRRIRWRNLRGAWRDTTPSSAPAPLWTVYVSACILPSSWE